LFFGNGLGNAQTRYVIATREQADYALKQLEDAKKERSMQ
jgi:hypothetical protein